jgi:fatty-acyl-CoA synthase
MAAAPLLQDLGVPLFTVGRLLSADPIDPIETGEDDLALMQLTSGSTGPPKAARITQPQRGIQRRGDVRRRQM